LEKLAGTEQPPGSIHPAATPLLDSALKRAEAQEKALRDALAASQPLSPPSPAPVSRRSVPAVVMTAKPKKSGSPGPKSSSAGSKAATRPPQPRDEKAKPADPALVGRKSPERPKDDHAPPSITDLRLCRKVLGFGVFEPLEGSGLRAGQTVLLYCEANGLQYQARGEAFVARLSSRVELAAARDGAKVWEQDLGEAEDECRSRRRDCYVNCRLTFPPTVPPGDYRLRLIQTDLLAHRSATAELPVTFGR
jgi:hypothetical protein